MQQSIDDQYMDACKHLRSLQTSFTDLEDIGVNEGLTTRSTRFLSIEERVLEGRKAFWDICVQLKQRVGKLTSANTREIWSVKVGQLEREYNILAQSMTNFERRRSVARVFWLYLC